MISKRLNIFRYKERLLDLLGANVLHRLMHLNYFFYWYSIGCTLLVLGEGPKTLDIISSINSSEVMLQ